MKFGFLFFIGLIIVFPSVAAASVVINEIMYDLDGTDTGREWIEVYNNGSDPVDMAGWRIYEAETNHKINLFKETDTFLLPAGSYAIMADDPAKFLTDWPNFSGVFFDSAFSFSNTGEAVFLRDAELNDIDNISYSSDLGANGDGNSLQKINGQWVTSVPTPGMQNNGVQNMQPEIVPDDTQPAEETVSSGNGGGSSYVPPEQLPKIKAYAGEDKTLIAGALAEFRGQGFGFNDEALKNARYLWNFGDGATQEGQNVTHAYRYVGNYKVVLTVSSGDSAVLDFLIAKVVPNEIFVSEVKNGVDSFIELSNASKLEIDISGWRLRFLSKEFIFPSGTFVRPGNFLAVSVVFSGLDLNQSKGTVEFLYPGGFLADSFIFDGVLAEGQSFIRSGKTSIVALETPGKENDLKIEVTKEPEQIISVLPAAKNISEQKNYPVKINEISDEEQISTTSDEIEQEQTANIAGVSLENKNSFWPYLLGALSLAVFAGVSVFYIRRNSHL